MTETMTREAKPTAATVSARSKTLIWVGVAAGLLLLFAANYHLVYVAVTSQPDCVAHIRSGQSDADKGQFSAAKSSCSSK